MEDLNRDPRKGDRFVHPSGAIEVVYSVVDGRLLTFREYPDATIFEMHNGEANYTGVHEEVTKIEDPVEMAYNE